MRKPKSTLLVGFDSAWSNKNKGAISAAFIGAEGTINECLPEPASLQEATTYIQDQQTRWSPTRTVVAVDQPIVVPNQTGQRDVENVVSSPIGKAGGGVQPTSRSRTHFNENAPIWDFVNSFGGPSDPTNLSSPTSLIETYPALCLLAINCTLSIENGRQRLPKYNPTKNNFSQQDWTFTCSKISQALQDEGFSQLSAEARIHSEMERPSKANQDMIDSLLCLLAAHSLVKEQAISVGTVESGYMITPSNRNLALQLQERCTATGRDPVEFVHILS